MEETQGKKKKKKELPILPKFPTTNIYYFVKRETIFLKKQKTLSIAWGNIFGPGCLNFAK